jgi:antitoxin component YwqK of YwqJK toxin-antitoxin module
MVNQIINNRREGFWKIRFSDDGGHKFKTGYYECNYVDGIRHGLYKEYNYKDVLVEIGEYYCGKKIKIWKKYCCSGELFSETNYNGDIVETRKYLNNKLWRWEMCVNGITWDIDYYEKWERKGIQIFEDKRIKAKRLYKGGKLIYKIDCKEMIHCINI